MDRHTGQLRQSRLAIASQNAKILHGFFIFNFGVWHVCILHSRTKIVFRKKYGEYGD